MVINHYVNKVIKWALHSTMISVMLFHIITSTVMLVNLVFSNYYITVFI